MPVRPAPTPLSLTPSPLPPPPAMVAPAVLWCFRPPWCAQSQGYGLSGTGPKGGGIPYGGVSANREPGSYMDVRKEPFKRDPYRKIPYLESDSVVGHVTFNLFGVLHSLSIPTKFRSSAFSAPTEWIMGLSNYRVINKVTTLAINYNHN